MTADLRVLEMSLQLARPETPKVMCRASTRNPRTGYIAHTCTMHAGHVDQAGQPNDHIDTHTGGRWKDAS